MDRTLGDLLAGLERAAAEAERPAIVTLLGDLERLKALLWHRLAVTAATATRAMPPADGLEELRHLTPHQVAELLSLKEPYVHELCRSGRLPAIKQGKYWIISVAGLRQWVAYRNGDVDAAATRRLESLNLRGDAASAPRPGRRAPRQQRPTPI